MLYKAENQLISKLIELPETGMGYQIITANGCDKKPFIVYNTEFIIDVDDNFRDYRTKLFTSYALIWHKLESIDLNSIKVFERKRNANSYAYSSNHHKRHKGGKAAIDSPETYANGKDTFIRLSAFENDRRIDEANKKLRKGSYTTTLEDYSDCRQYEDDPVDRYALPNDDKIKWVFYIKPKSGDVYQQGIVQPDYDHEGGGIEAFFKNGTSNDTYYYKMSY